MSVKKNLPIVYTAQAFSNSKSIQEYLFKNFSKKEIEQFYSHLFTFENTVSIFPKLYPVINKKFKIRRAVLTKVLTVFYRIVNDRIEVLAILDSRCDISKWI